MEFNESTIIIITFLVAFLSNIILTIITGNRPQFRLAVVLTAIGLGLTWQSWLI